MPSPIQTHLTHFIQTTPIVVFTVSYCPFCDELKSLLSNTTPPVHFVPDLDVATAIDLTPKRARVSTSKRGRVSTRGSRATSRTYRGDAIRDALKTLYPGHRTMPMVFVGGELVGGCDDVKGLMDSGGWKKKVEGVKRVTDRRVKSRRRTRVKGCQRRRGKTNGRNTRTVSRAVQGNKKTHGGVINETDPNYQEAVNNLQNMTNFTNTDMIIKKMQTVLNAKCKKKESEINDIMEERDKKTLIDNIIISDNDDGNYNELKYTKIPAGTYFYRRQNGSEWRTNREIWFDYFSKHAKVTDTSNTFLTGRLWNTFLKGKFGPDLTLYRLKQDVIVLHFPFNVHRKLDLNVCAKFEYFIRWFANVDYMRWAIHGYTADCLTYYNCKTFETKDCIYEPNHRELCLLRDVNNEQYLEFIGVCDENGTLESHALRRQIHKDGYKTIDIGNTPYIVSDIHDNQLTIDTDRKGQQLLITSPRDKDIKAIVEEVWKPDSAGYVQNPLLNDIDTIQVEDTTNDTTTVTGKIKITKYQSLQFVTDKPKE